MAEQEEDSGEKEFDATEQRLRQAREEGNIPQSKEVNGLAVVVGLAICASLLASLIGPDIQNRFSSLFYHVDAFSADVFTAQGFRTRKWLSDVLLRFLPIFGVLAICVLIVLVVTRGISFSAKKIKPDMKKLSPVDNLKKKYGKSGLLDFLKDTAKMLFAGLIASVFLFQFARDYYGGSAIQEGHLAAFTFGQVMRLIIAFAIFQFTLAAIDLPLQHRLHANKLKMTREEMKKESKQSEGDPMVKQQRRQKGQQIASGQMLLNVKDATVVMVNPEHYAVALKWDPASNKAPICVAKGVDHLAAKIREVAKANEVPIYRDPPSTRSIYRLVDIDEEIHPEHFAAVAAAVQFAESLARKN